MRDPARISKIMDLLVFIWQSEGYTDLRFNQLIANLQSEYSGPTRTHHKKLFEREVNDKYDITCYRPYDVPDLFNVEDDLWMSFLKTKLDEIKGSE